MSSIRKHSHRNRAQWQALIARAEHSELSVTEFCQRESVSVTSFYSWRKRLRRKTELQSAPTVLGADFIDLGSLADAKDNTAPWEVELDLGAGMVLRLKRG